MENSEPSPLLRGKGFCDQQWFLPKAQGGEVTRYLLHIFSTSQLPAGAAYAVRELPSLAPLLLTGIVKRLNHWPNCILLAIFLIYYVQWALTFLFLNQGGKSKLFHAFLLAFVFCICNGYLQSTYLNQ